MFNMELTLHKLQKTDFDFLNKMSFQEKDFESIRELLTPEHNVVDNTPTPSWASQVQDIFENKVVTYTEREIQELDFLGLKVIKNEESVIVSLGRVGDVESVIEILFNKTQDGETFTLQYDSVKTMDSAVA